MPRPQQAAHQAEPATTEGDKPAYSSMRIHVEGNMAAPASDISREHDGTVAVFRIAGNYRTTRGEEDAFWYDVRCINPYLSANVLATFGETKGRVHVEGRIEGRWFTTNAGEEVHQMVIIADSVSPSLRYDAYEKIEPQTGSSNSSRRGEYEAPAAASGRGRATTATDDTQGHPSRGRGVTETPPSGRGRPAPAASGRTGRGVVRRGDDDAFND